VKLQAITVLNDAGNDESADLLVKNWDKLSTPELKTAAAQLLATKARWARTLLTGVQAKKVVAADIPLPALRAIAEHAGRDVSLKTLMSATVGMYRPTPGEKQKLIEDKKAVVMTGQFDKTRGKELFTKHCAVCHKLNGEGAEVGPDITGVGRGTLDLLLNNVIDPDQIIGAGYENTIVDTEDGDTKSGRLVEDTDTYIKLLTAGPREDVIQKKDIKERRTSQKSVMPEGFEQIMKDDEFRDLIRYVLEAPAK
jgi:putative heme-binding domain-containing protein